MADALRATAGVPPTVSRALAETGRPLEPPTRAALQPATGVDLGAVSIHTGALASRAAEDLGAEAFTSGGHIVFRAGRYHPDTEPGRRLLAHELTHVRQQAEGRTAALVGAGGDEVARGGLEREADRATGSVTAPARTTSPAPPAGPAPVQMQASPGMNPFSMVGCAALMMVPGFSDERTGRKVHRKIREHFTETVGPIPRVRIPEASFTPYRTGAGEVIGPQHIGGRAGVGEPDLACRSDSGDAMLLAEIKPANPGAFVDGEAQLKHYIDKGNLPENAPLREQLGVKAFSPMPTTKYRPPDMLEVGARLFTVTWCGQGLLVYKEIPRPVPPPVRHPVRVEDRSRGVADPDAYRYLVLAGAAAALSRAPAIGQALGRLAQAGALAAEGAPAAAAHAFRAGAAAGGGGGGGAAGARAAAGGARAAAVAAEQGAAGSRLVGFAGRAGLVGAAAVVTLKTFEAVANYTYGSVIPGSIAAALTDSYAAMRSAAARIAHWYPVVVEAWGGAIEAADAGDSARLAAGSELYRSIRPLHEAVYEGVQTVLGLRRRYQAIASRVEPADTGLEQLEALDALRIEGAYPSPRSPELLEVTMLLLFAADRLGPTMRGLHDERDAIIVEQARHTLERR